MRSPESVSVTPTESATLALSFANPPSHEVVVRLSTDNDGAVMYTPTELVFTPEDHATEKVVTMTGTAREYSTKPMKLLHYLVRQRVSRC